MSETKQIDDADILEGRAHCYRCGRSWWMTDEQMRQEIRWQASMIECAEENEKTEPQQ